MADSSSDDLPSRAAAFSRGRCAYCHMPFAIFPAACEFDHIIPRAAGGSDDEENLCLCCGECNRHKSAKLAAPDPLSGLATPLFHPRHHRWQEHFAWSNGGVQLVGLTPVGRATVVALVMNNSALLAARQLWIAAGWHPPSDDPVLT
jgi:hypothetical protein